MRSIRNLIKDERGANAVEYGLIAAFLGIGIIGSLVTTRTSLSSVFGTVGTNMNSGINGSSGSSGTTTPAAQQPNPAFAGKTLSSRTATPRVWGATQYDYVYTDGSKATYYSASAYRGSYYSANASMTDASTGKTYTYLPPQTDTTSNTPVSPNLGVVDYYPSGNQKSYTTYSFNSDGVTLSGTQRTYPDQSGAASNSTSSVTATVSQFQGYIDQTNAYMSNP